LKKRRTAKNPPLNLAGLKTTSLLKGRRKVKAGDFARPVSPDQSFSKFWRQGLPDILAGENIKKLARNIAAASRKNKQVILAMGAHPIKVGLSPLIIDFIRRGIISAVAGNGALAVHDFEIALAGFTSEDVEKSIQDGSFGAARETGAAFREVARRCAEQEIGFGAALGEYIIAQKLPFRHLSIFANARQQEIPATVHIALGTDIVHMHPGMDGAGLGRGSLLDFRVFAGAVSRLENGVFINLGSAVVMPEVFLKAVSLSRNLGYRLEKFTSANLDFILHYRPRVNVLERPTGRGGTSINLIGHHEILLPLLFTGVLAELKGGRQ
jgi:hypothetical protein